MVRNQHLVRYVQQAFSQMNTFKKLSQTFISLKTGSQVQQLLLFCVGVCAFLLTVLATEHSIRGLLKACEGHRHRISPFIPRAFDLFIAAGCLEILYKYNQNCF